MIFAEYTRKKMANLKGRNWCLTSHHQKSYDRWQKIDLIENNMKYLVFQEEKAPSQEESKEAPKMHVQGYVEMMNACGIKHLREIFRDKGIHCELRKGTSLQASNYCKKEETRNRPPIEKGEMGKQGDRTDLKTMYEAAKAGKSDLELLELDAGTYMRNFKAIEKVRTILGRRGINDCTKKEITCYVGKMKWGLTEFILKNCNRDDVYIKNFDGKEKVWWDGYVGQKILLIEDFGGEIKPKSFGKIIGDYGVTLEIKGGTVTSKWEKIYITSTQRPNSWWKLKHDDAILENIRTVKLKNDKFELADPWTD